MFAGFLAAVLSMQAAQHNSGKCECSVKVVSWIAIVDGGFGANGLQAQTRFIPNSIRNVDCSYAKRLKK